MDDTSPVGVQARWAIDLLSPAGPDIGEDVAGHFVRAFLDKHPDGLAALLRRWRAQGPFTVLTYTSVAHKAWVLLLGPTDTRSTLSLVVDSTGLIRILDLQPELVVPKIHGWAELDAALAAPGVVHSFLAARVGQGRYTPLHQTAADRLMPAGSTFKLYVLHALVQAVQAGEVRWDDQLIMLPELRSLPTGDMQELPDGTSVSVREAAHKMIAISDNTAADMIMNRIGRHAVERAVLDMGHHDPAVLRPFLSSREVFQIGWGDPALRAAWTTAADEHGRRALLQQVNTGPLTAHTQHMVRPVHHLGLDWFVGAQDLCQAQIALWHQASSDATGTVRSILTANPGVAIDRAQWPSSTFKGGSNPGLMTFSWLLEDPRGVPHVVVMQRCSADPAAVRDPRLLLGLGEQVINFLLTTASARHRESISKTAGYLVR
jgi:beta-lactamase class A